jgi:hypothetical protein
MNIDQILAKLAAIKKNASQVTRDGGLSLSHRDLLANVDSLASEIETALKGGSAPEVAAALQGRPNQPAATGQVPPPPNPDQQAAGEKSKEVTGNIQQALSPGHNPDAKTGSQDGKPPVTTESQPSGSGS